MEPIGTPEGKDMKENWLHIGGIVVGLIAALFATLGGLALIDASFATSVGLTTPLPGNVIAGMTTTAAEYLVFIPALLLLLGAIAMAMQGSMDKLGHREASVMFFAGAVLAIFLANWALGIGFIAALLALGVARSESC